MDVLVDALVDVLDVLVVLVLAVLLVVNKKLMA